MTRPEDGSEDGKDGEVVVIKNAKVKMLNVFLVGLCFTGVFTGFNTMGQTQVKPAIGSS
jgi:hypothetical protein